jgi:hypothetical protein
MTKKPFTSATAPEQKRRSAYRPAGLDILRPSSSFFIVQRSNDTHRERLWTTSRVTLGPDNSLLVADDVGNVVWRVTGERQG